MIVASEIQETFILFSSLMKGYRRGCNVLILSEHFSLSSNAIACMYVVIISGSDFLSDLRNLPPKFVVNLFQLDSTRLIWDL